MHQSSEIEKAELDSDTLFNNTYWKNLHWTCALEHFGKGATLKKLFRKCPEIHQNCRKWVSEASTFSEGACPQRPHRESTQCAYLLGKSYRCALPVTLNMPTASQESFETRIGVSVRVNSTQLYHLHCPAQPHGTLSCKAPALLHHS